MVASALDHLDASQLIGVMMTGMGNDGAEAMKRLRLAGGRTIAEAESSAIVWGMPGELVKNGGAEKVRPLEDIAATIIDMVSSSCPWLEAAKARQAVDLAPHRAALDGPDAESRWTAARALSGDADAVPALAAALGREPVPRVREAIMTALMRIGNFGKRRGDIALSSVAGRRVTRRRRSKPCRRCLRPSRRSWRRC